MWEVVLKYYNISEAKPSACENVTSRLYGVGLLWSFPTFSTSLGVVSCCKIYNLKRLPHKYSIGGSVMWDCKHCKQQFAFTKLSDKANHSRWCVKNPNHKTYVIGNSKRGTDLAKRRYGEVVEHEVSCTACFKDFKVSVRQNLFDVSTKYYCSRSCANSVGGQAKQAKYLFDGKSSYRSICFRYHKKECVVCNFKDVVDVHHRDKDRTNNTVKNLVPLCPNHHRMVHLKKFKVSIEKEIDYYFKSLGL